MKLIQCVFVLAFVVGAAVAQEAVTPPADANPANLPVAKVGDHEITGEEFGRFARLRLHRMSMEAGKEIQADAKFRMQTMSELVASHILAFLAKEAKVTVTEEEVSADFEESKKLFKTPEEYQEYLKLQGMSEEQLREEVRRKLYVDRYVESRTTDLKATPEEVQTEYDALKAKGAMNRDTRTADLVQIVALFEPGDTASEEAAKAKIDGLRERIAKGEKFEDVGTEVSKQPDAGMQMGTIDEARPAALYPDIARAVEILKPGEYSATLKTPRGYGVVLVKAWYEPGTVPLEKVKAKIEQRLLMQKQRASVTEIITEARKRIPIEIYKAPAGEQKPAAPAAPADPAAPAAPEAPAAIPPADLSATQ